MIELSGIVFELPDAEASAASSSTQCLATVLPEHAARPSPNHSNLTECTGSRRPKWRSLFQVWADWSFCMAVPGAGNQTKPQGL
jgi:hypothetical protein